MRVKNYLAALALLTISAVQPIAVGGAVASAHSQQCLSGCLAGESAILRSSAWLQSDESSSASHEELFKWINFLIMVGVLGYFLRKPLSNFFSDRLDAIQEALNQGRQAAEASEAKLAEIERKLGNVQQEIAAFRADSEREMAVERERLKQSAELEAQRILDFAQVQIEAATRLAKAELKKYAAKQALDLAEAQVRQRMDDSARQRLVGSFVAGLKNKAEIKN